MLCTRLQLKTPPPGTSAAVRYTCNHDQQGVQPRGFSGRWGLQPGFHLSAEEILQSCNMKSYSHVTLQKKKKEKNLRLRRGYKPQNKTSGRPGNVQLGKRDPQENATDRADSSLSFQLSESHQRFHRCSSTQTTIT